MLTPVARSDSPVAPAASPVRSPSTPLRIALLTAGRDKPYALGLGPALANQGLAVDFIGSDTVDGPEVRNHPRIRYFNLRNQAERASLWSKMTRVFAYYARLIAYAARSEAPVFHILWNNKFEYFDRTLLLLYYRALGKRLVFTAHNVNIGKRDNNDTALNRFTLRLQYRLCHHIFIHTRRMQAELTQEFGVPLTRSTVIPFGINNTLPSTSLSAAEARRELNLGPDDQVMLFFGNIAPYKGVDVLVEAMVQAAPTRPALRLVVAGRPKGSESYWESVRQRIAAAGLSRTVFEHIEYIPDAKVEVFFKAADVLVLPYKHVFQSGVLFLGYSFGLPVIATDVGSLREEIIEGQTGWVCPPCDPVGLGQTIAKWLDSDLYRERHQRRTVIQAHANREYSWSTVGEITRGVYDRVLGSPVQPPPS